jgi:rhodanese-related sulfurtransferase
MAVMVQYSLDGRRVHRDYCDHWRKLPIALDCIIKGKAMALPPRVTHLDLATVRAGLADGSMLIIDVREPHEYAAGRIPGAVLLPLSQFDPARIPQGAGKRVVFSCAAGVRSQHALAMVQAAGLGLTEHYLGGFKEWYGAGEPIES